METAWVVPLSSVSSHRKLLRFVRRPVPHDVVTALPRPQIVVGARDRIAEKLLAGRQAERHRRKKLTWIAGGSALSGTSARQAT